MENELKEKINILKQSLGKRNNKSFLFFEKLLIDLECGNIESVINSIIPAYSIVQYGNFNNFEETIFEEIWNIANSLKSTI
jgi:hypothetical protein